MEQGSSNTQNLIIAGVVLLVLLGAGYFYATRDRVSDTDLLVGVPINRDQVIDGDLLSTLGQLKRLRLDETIFSNQSFMSLTDQSKPLPAQTSGRANPFAPFDATPSVFPSSSTPSR
jgi:hypothetical protein